MQPHQGRLHYEFDRIRRMEDQNGANGLINRLGNLCSPYRLSRLASLSALGTERGTLDEVIQGI